MRALNALRLHMPVLLALSGNSPFWQGRDSGLASARTPAFQAFPRTGTARRFASYGEYVEAIDVLVRCDAIPEPTFLWWDARLQPAFGTVEVRVMDAQTQVQDTAALTALVQCLVRLEAERDEAAAQRPPRRTRSSPRTASSRRATGCWRSLIDPPRARAGPRAARRSSSSSASRSPARWDARTSSRARPRWRQWPGAARQRAFAARGGLEARGRGAQRRVPVPASSTVRERTPTHRGSEASTAHARPGRERERANTTPTTRPDDVNTGAPESPGSTSRRSSSTGRLQPDPSTRSVGAALHARVLRARAAPPGRRRRRPAARDRAGRRAAAARAGRPSTVRSRPSTCATVTTRPSPTTNPLAASVCPGAHLHDRPGRATAGSRTREQPRPPTARSFIAAARSCRGSPASARSAAARASSGRRAARAAARAPAGPSRGAAG